MRIESAQQHEMDQFQSHFLRATAVLILISISVPFMTDIFHAATESSHLFYKASDTDEKANPKRNSNLIHFKQSITEHANIMKRVAISCKYIGILGFISYLTLELVSSLGNVSIARIISHYLILMIAMFFAICNMFHHLRLYQHMNKLHHFIATCEESKPKILAKFVRTKKRLLFISATSLVVVIIAIVSLVTNRNYHSSAFFATDLGYFGYIWSVMLYQMIFHVWCFQSWTKIPPSSLAFALCHCFKCCRNVWMKSNENIKHLGTEVGQFEKEKASIDMKRVARIKDDARQTGNELKIETTTNIHAHRQCNPHLLAIQHVTTLTPYSPIEAPGHLLTPPISTRVNKDIKVVIYDINVLLSLAYTTQDALELIQTRPIEWMTNKHVKNRLFDFEYKRAALVTKHIEFIRHKGHKTICVISNGFDEVKMKTLIGMLNAESLVDISYSRDNDKWNKEKNNLSVIILDIMSRCQCNNDEVLFIGNELEQIKYLKHIDLCSLFPLYTCDTDDVQIPTNLTAKHINDLNQYLTKNQGI